MNYRKVGSTELELSTVTFGAWAIGGWLWGGTDQKQAVEAIRASWDMGVTSIDTAPVYGMGLSEEIVREAIRDIPRDKVQILTKYGLRWDLKRGEFHGKGEDSDGNRVDIYRYAGKESVIEEFEASLRRLGTDYIDLYHIHWPDPTTPIDETMEAVLRLRDQGKIREAGVSNYSVEQMAEAEKILPLASNQVPYSMVRRDIEEDLVPYCRKNKKGILAYSPLQRGLLTGKMKPGQRFPEGDNRSEVFYFNDANIGRVNRFLEEIRPIADSKSASLAQLVIQWTIRQPGITVALVGARNAAQATENAKAADIELTSEEAKFIEDKLELVTLKRNS